MEYSNINQVNRLVQERRSITAALASFDQGGRIIAMSVGQPPPADQPMPALFGGAQVNTAFIDYPPAMVEAIKAALTARQGAITNELAQLGVTGSDAPTPQAAAPMMGPRGRRVQ